MKQQLNHSWVEISKKALLHNIRAYHRVIGPHVKLMTVVKSNAYGHGFDLVSKVVQSSRQVDWLGVASLNEALDVRQSGVKLPILVLSYFRPFVLADIEKAIKSNIFFVVYEPEQIKVLERVAQKINHRAKVHLKINTGLNRLGFSPSEALRVLKKLYKSNYISVEGVISHLATAESKNQKFTNEQLIALEDFLGSARIYLPKNVLVHIACSAAISSSINTRYNFVRLGIGLYGLWPSLDNQKTTTRRYAGFNLKPVLTWKTQVIQVQRIASGSTVGYDRTYKIKKPMIVAVIPVGYWDGYDRRLSNKGTVLIRGTHCPIIGRICMNVSMVDVSRLKGRTRTGDEVVLIGKQGKESVTADEMANKTETINYEIVTRINSQLKRILT